VPSVPEKHDGLRHDPVPGPSFTREDGAAPPMQANSLRTTP